MSGQSGSVNVNYSSSGAGSVTSDAAAVKSAIESIPTSRTCVVNIVTIRSGDAAGDLGRVWAAADKAERSARGMGDSFDRAGRSARGMGDNFDRAGDHVGRAADEAERLRTHLDAVDNIMNGGAPGAVQQAQGMRNLADEAGRARGAIGAIGSESSRSIGALGTGGSRAAQTLREIGSGAQRSHEQVSKLADTMQRSASTFEVTSGGRTSGGGVANKLPYGDQTGQRSSNFAVDSAGNVSSRLSGASKGMERFGGSTASTGKEMELFGGKATEMERHVGSAGRIIDATERKMAGTGGGGGAGFMGGAGAVGLALGPSMEKAAGALNSVETPAIAAKKAIMGVGLAGGVSAAGMGILAGAVAGVGLAGVALDFAHNNQLMNEGQDAVRGFNKQFAAMRSETTANGLPQMDAVKGSLAGVGRELASIGAKNIGSTLADAAALGNSTTSAMKQLEPAIPPAIEGLTALAGAVVGAFGSSGPAVTSFANNITKNASGIQSTTEGIIGTMSGLANATVDTFANLPQGMDNVGSSAASWTDKAAQWVGDQGRSMLDGKSFSPLSARPAGPGPGGFGTGTDGSAASSGPKYQDSGWKPAKSTGVGDFDSQGQFGLPKLPPGGGRTSPDAAWAKGMTGEQIQTAQRARIGLGPVGRPEYDGHGAPPAGLGKPLPGAAPTREQQSASSRLPRVGGPGSAGGGRPMASATAAGLGSGPLAPLNDMMSAASKSVSSAPMGQAMSGQVKTMKKVMDSGQGDMAAGGAGLGSSAMTGVATGMQSEQTVTDTIVRKHMKKIIDAGAEGLDSHSPSRKFHALGQSIPQGLGGGIETDAYRAYQAMAKMTGRATSMGSQMNFAGSKNSPDYGGSSGLSISVRKGSSTKANYGDPQAAQKAAAPAAGQQQSAIQYSPAIMDRIAGHNAGAEARANNREGLQRQAIGGMTHNERAAQLAQGRADLHEKALANLGVPGHVDPTKNVNPFAGDQNPSLWNTISQDGPLGDLKSQFSQHGESMAQGVSVGLNKGAPDAQNQMSQFSKDMQNQHKRDNGINSPSTVYAGFGGDMAAGVGVGITAGTPGVASAALSASAAVSTSWGGAAYSSGREIGKTYATSVADGMQTTFDTKSLKSIIAPQLDNPMAKSVLGGLGFMGPAGSGAQQLQMFAAQVAQLGGGSGPDTVTVQIPATPVMLNGNQIATIADRRVNVAIGQIRASVPRQSGR